MPSRLEKGKFPVTESYSYRDFYERQNEIREVAIRMHELICETELLKRILHTPALNELGLDLQALDNVPVQLLQSNTSEQLLETLKMYFKRLVFICELPLKSASKSTGYPPLLEPSCPEDFGSIAQLVAQVLGHIKRIIRLIELELKTGYCSFLGKLYTRRVSRLKCSLQKVRFKMDKFASQGQAIPEKDKNSASSLQNSLEKLEYLMILCNANLLKHVAQAKGAQIRQDLQGKDVLLASYLQYLCHLRSEEAKFEAERERHLTRSLTPGHFQVQTLLHKHECQYVATARRVEFDLQRLREVEQKQGQLKELIGQIHQILV